MIFPKLDDFISQGKPEMLWITVELKFPNKVWAEFLSEEQREVRRIEKKVRNNSVLWSVFHLITL